MKDLIYNLFENRKQRLAWIIYIIFTFFLGLDPEGRFSTVIAFTLVFVVITLLLRDRQKGKNDPQN